MVVKEEEPQVITNESTEVPETIPEITLPILKIIKDAQQQHGLRHGDYQRYRGYCSRRIRRLRKVLKIPQSDRRHFKKRDVTETMVKDERYLQIPLMLAERAWGYAMQLRQESNTEPRKRFHLVSRLRKATTYALHLQHLCDNTPCDTLTRLEAQAYVAWMHGALYFELQLWKPAIENFKKAQMVYEKLSAALSEEGEQNVYKARVEEITPNLRYCAYNVGDETAIDDLMRMRGQAAHSDLLNNLDELMAQSRSRHAAEGGGEDEVSWKGRAVIVRPERARAFLVAEKQIAQALQQAPDLNARIAILEAHLLECKDAVAAARDEAKAKNTSTTPLLSYLTWIRLTKTIERNRLMVAQAVNRKARSQDLTRLHEIVLQNLQELAQVPGLEDDIDHQREVESQTLIARASRSYQMARTLAAAGKWREAVGLFRRAEKRVLETLAKTEGISPEQREELITLQLEITASQSDAHAHAVLEAEGEGKEEDSTPAFPGRGGRAVRRPLSERLNEYREDPSLTTKAPNVFRLPPEMRPIPCKPLFFDLACNLAEFPSLDDKLEVTGKKQQAGVTGFVKGLLGWGGGAK